MCSSCRIFAVVVIAASVLLENFTLACDCDFHTPGNGCVISVPADEGAKCKCQMEYLGAWTCNGVEVDCAQGENCPGNCSSVVCCVNGGGDCGGY